MYKRKKAFDIDSTIKTFTFDTFVPWRCSGERDKNTLYAFESRYCDCSDGAMRTGVMIKQYKNANNKAVTYTIDPSTIARIFLEHDKKSDGSYTSTPAFLTKNGDYYYAGETATSFTKVTSVNKGSTCEVAAYADAEQGLYTLLFGAGGVTRVASGACASSNVSENVSCGCVLNDRAYAIGAFNALLYSALLDPLDFTESIHEGGNIKLPDYAGKAVAIKPLNGKVYVFFEYGITEIEPAGSGKDFKRTPFPYHGGKIQRGTVGECMGKLYFMATDGVYALDGIRAERKFEKLCLRGGETAEPGGFAAYKGGFLLRYYDVATEWRTIYLQPATDNGYRILDVNAISETGGEVFCAYKKTLYKFVEDGMFASGENAFFNTEPLDFGSERPKLLKTLCVRGDGIFDIWVTNGKRRVYVGVGANLQNGRAVAKPRLFGENFRFEIVLYKGATLQEISCETENF